MVKIFDINEGIIVINTNCLLIPELKKISEIYKDPIPVLGYIHYMSDPLSAYANLPEDEKEERVLQDYPGDYTPDDEAVYKAVEKMRVLYETPSMLLLKQAKAGLKTLGDYLAKASISDGKDSNLPGFQNALKSIGKINQEYKVLERDVQEELRIRGQGAIGYDEFS